MIQLQTIDVVTISASTAEDRYLVHGLDGEWQLEAAFYAPSTTDALSGTNYTTIALKQGATTLGSLSNETVAFTAGTAREFTLTGGTALEFGESDAVNINKAETGSGGILDGAITLRWRKVRI